MPARKTSLATNLSPSHAFSSDVIFTVGHSTRPIANFVSLLEAYGIRQILDIRTIPRSRHNPQFNAEALAAALSEAGIRYIGCPALGGLRHARKDSPNDGWRNKSFRGYADYMQTDAFGDGLNTLIAARRSQRTAIMCAEAVPWRCHRSLVADALLVRGIEVVDILTESDWRSHKLTPFARVEGTAITYPSEQGKLL